ncbi:23S rRNA (adenine(2503)-C(2))-methyltransferase RlmN [Candidatus Margulisiibacteriota bacterium]
MLINILDLSPDEITQWCKKHNEPPYRTKQILKGIYQENKKLKDIKTLPKKLKEQLQNTFEIYMPQIVKEHTSKDQTAKYLLKLHDGKSIETVVIPEKGYQTQCISTQVGCPFKCIFCQTGQAGFERNLTSGEILGQIITAKKKWNNIKNIVFMGMGEPLLNTDEVIKSLEMMTHKEAMNSSQKRITISTIGLVKPLKKVITQFPKINITVSLHTPFEKQREKIIPVKKDSIKKIIHFFQQNPTIKVTIAYILMKDINDSIETAQSLAELIKPLKCHVNIIRYNETKNKKLYRSSEETIHIFMNSLRENNINVFRRESRGEDIQAACGQLRG